MPDAVVVAAPADAPALAQAPTAPIRVTLFGALTVTVPGHPTVRHFPTHKTAATLACLALRLGQPQVRGALAELVWPDVEPASQRASLSAALSALRRVLEPTPESAGSAIRADRQCVTLRGEGVTTDVSEFEVLMRSADGHRLGSDARIQVLARAVALHPGELLPGFYEDWIGREQERQARRYVDALLLLASSWEAAGGPGSLAEAANAARRAVDADPLSEAANHQLIRLLAHDGRTSAALQAYAKAVERYAAAWNVEPPLALRRLSDDLRAGHLTAVALPAAAPVGTPTVAPVGAADAAASSPPSETDYETGGGAVPLNSRFYVEREGDSAFYASLDRGDSIVLIKGARQVGKTSLLARGAERMRRRGSGNGDALETGEGRDLVVLTDFQKIGQAQMATDDGLCRLLAATIARQLRFSYDFAAEWDGAFGAYLNLEIFVTAAMESIGDRRLVWCMDEVDKIFTTPFASDFFGLVRSWHNARSLDASGPWRRLTVVITYATEAQLFIRDLNQSPFNVGARIALHDFTSGQIADLNGRYGAPLNPADGLARFAALVGGQPYLVRRGLGELAVRRQDSGPLGADAVEALAAEALRDEGVFSGHLRRLRYALEQDEELRSSVQAMLRGGRGASETALYRLRSAGVLRGETIADGAHFRCELYARYLDRYLR